MQAYRYHNLRNFNRLVVVLFDIMDAILEISFMDFETKEEKA